MPSGPNSTPEPTTLYFRSRHPGRALARSSSPDSHPAARNSCRHPCRRSSRPDASRCFPCSSRRRSSGCAASASARSYAAGERILARPARSRRARSSSCPARSRSPSTTSWAHASPIVTPRPGLVHGRAGPALRPPGAGRRACAEARSRRWSSRRAGCATAGGRGRAGRAHHARADPAPRRPARDRRRRAGHRRPRRQWRRAAAGRISSRATAIRISGSIPTPIRARKTLLERFHVAPRELPIVLCPDGQLLRNPSEGELARCIGLVGPIDPDKVYDVAIVGAGPAGLAAAVYAGIRRAVGAGARLPRLRRPGRRLGADRELSRLSRPASPAWR